MPARKITKKPETAIRMAVPRSGCSAICRVGMSTSTRDYWGNTVPSRDMLQDGTKGTLGKSINFWTAVEDGTIILEGEYGDDD